jgi:hypothetical protein
MPVNFYDNVCCNEWPAKRGVYKSVTLCCCPLTYGPFYGPAHVQPETHLHAEARHARVEVRPPGVAPQQPRH